MARRRWWLPASAAALVLVLGAAAQALPADGNAASPAAGSTDSTDSTTRVTLVTGDTVVLHGSAVQEIEPGPGRENIRFATYWLGDNLHVIPSDARRGLAEGRLDERLFDVTQLVEWEYDDAGRDRLPLIAERSGGQRSGSGMDALTVEKADATGFWNHVSRDGVDRLWLDGKVEVALDKSVPRIGAPKAWDVGYDGSGALVAVLDTGYAKQHPDLEGVVNKAKGFTDQGPDDVADGYGHGTHVASTIAGSGAKSNGKYKGVAPGAKLAVGKVLDDFGFGQESWIIDGMEWAANEVKADVVNMSLGGTDAQGVDPMERAVNRLTRQTGTLFVTAAGNEGSERTIGSPASADAALAVGAVDDRDQLAGFSSQGPRLGDYAVKPDLTAPGVNIKAAMPPAEGSWYGTSSGTSMASPHVAGAAAILAQQHPGWTADELAGALVGSAKPTAGLDEYQQGAGRVDVARAVRQPVSASIGNLSTYLRWPATEPVTRKVTYTNHGDQPVELELTAPEGPFELSASSVTVPADGTATVEVTIDPKAARPGDYKGTLVATDGDTVVRTILGAYVEPRAYDVDATAIDRHGKPVDGLLLLHSRSEAFHEWVWFDNGQAGLRLPAGEYNLAGVVETPKPQEPWGWTLVNQPVDVRHGDQEVVIDTRKANRPTMTVDDPTAESSDYPAILAQYDQGEANYTIGGGWDASTMSVLPVRQRGLSYFHFEEFRKKDSPWNDNPYSYAFVDHRRGGIPSDPTYAGKVDELAELSVSYRSTTGGKGEGESTLGLVLPGGVSLGASPNAVDTPSTVKEYVTPSRTFGWWREFFSLEDNLIVQSDEPLRYSPGRHRETWLAAAFGPALPDVCFETLTGPAPPCATRTGNRLTWIGESSLAVDAGGPGRRGLDFMEGTAKLTDADGTVLADYELGSGALTATLPRRPATYTLTANADRSYARLSTEVDATYTFRSGQTERRTELPFIAVRFTPNGLDGFNRAKAGSTTTLPIWIERYGESPVRSLEVEVSYDDGKTWRPVRVRSTGDETWTTRIENPASGFVSLRVKAEDGAGNSVVQTVIRGYEVR